MLRGCLFLSWSFPTSALLLPPSIHQLRSKVSEEHDQLKKQELEQAPRAAYGYGGKFGTEKDRMDKVWWGWGCLLSPGSSSHFGMGRS